MIMEMGSNEWLAKVEENYNFPVVLAFYTSHETKGIFNIEIETKAQNVGDIKYSKVGPYDTINNGEALALIGVNRIHSAKQYFQITKDYKEKWGAK